MAEKLPRLRLKTHPATAIFSQHLRITRNCRSFVPFHLYQRSVPGNPRAVHCLTPRTRCPCHERNGKSERERKRDGEKGRRGIIVMSNRKLTLNRGPTVRSSFDQVGSCGAAKKNTLAPEHPFTRPSDHPRRIGQLLNFRGIIGDHCRRRRIENPLDISRYYPARSVTEDRPLHNLARDARRRCFLGLSLGDSRPSESTTRSRDPRASRRAYAAAIFSFRLRRNDRTPASIVLSLLYRNFLRTWSEESERGAKDY